VNEPSLSRNSSSAVALEQLANIRLSEIDIEHPEAKKHYEEMGTHPLIDQHENVVVIPR